MAFECPSCKAASSLVIARRIEVDPPAPSSETSVQLVECKDCHFRALAVYQESRAGALDSESVGHRGYPLDDSEFESFAGIIKECPDRLNRHCRCPSHLKLDKLAASDSWPGASNQNSFPLRMAA